MGGERALSEYFSVTNIRDGGLNTTIACPSGAPSITGTKRPPDNGNGGNNYPGAVLGGAIAGTAAFFIILFVGGFFLGKKKGWFRGKGGYQPADADGEMSIDTAHRPEHTGIRDGVSTNYMYSGAGGDAQMTGGNEVHQFACKHGRYVGSIRALCDLRQS